MKQPSLDFYKILSEELDPEKLQHKFLSLLLDLQNVERGSIWVKRENRYLCIEAVGIQSEKIKGVSISAEHPSIVGWVIENGQMTIAEAGKDSRHYKEIEDKLTVKSNFILCFPLFLKNREVYGAVQLIDTSTSGDRLKLDREYLDLLQSLIDIGSITLSNSLAYTSQVKENLRLKQTLEKIRKEEKIIGQSPFFLKIRKAVRDYAKTDFPVLITGESGTGKEVIAEEIHRLSHRKDKPFLVQNCSAIPDTLLESELFGYQKGAFTGAVRDKSGLFEEADGGTVFLDEIGDMSFHLQARILRVLQNGEIKPLGRAKARKVDVRIISATNKDLRKEISRDQFREDLFYRLNVLPLHLPPLRERREDIPLLVNYFLRQEIQQLGITTKKISNEVMQYLIHHPWKGNIRELENFVKYTLVITEGDSITMQDLPLHLIEEQNGEAISPGSSIPKIPVSNASSEKAGVPAVFSGGLSLAGYSWEELEKMYVLQLLEKNKWNVTHAAKDAGVNRSTFDSRMKKLGIRKS